jgi:hypothetical protein
VLVERERPGLKRRDPRRVVDVRELAAASISTVTPFDERAALGMSQ